MNKPSQKFKVSRAMRWLILLSAAALVLACSVEAGVRAAFSRSLYAQLSRPVPRERSDRIEFVGSAASGKVLDGGGGWFNGGRLTEIVVRSAKTGNGWDCPTNVVIRNGRLRGGIRVMGMGRNGEAREVLLSSRSEGHTARAQAAAPTRILVSNVLFEACGSKPIYLAPGVTEVTVEACTFTGGSGSVALYLDAESGRNVIRNNRFAACVGREVIAVDGSAFNRIEGNRFECLSLGGIYLYRNCGEGGTVRHQTPHGNVIANNSFDTKSLGWRAYGIWLGSRNGLRSYRDDDAGYPFGSSADNRDFACDNVVEGNVFEPECARDIRDDGENNHVSR